MASNRIVSSVNLKTITKGGKDIVLSSATKTQIWERPKDIAKSQATGFDESVAKRQEPLPAGTAEIILR